MNSEKIDASALARWVPSAIMCLMNNAVATFTRLSSTEALIEVSYPNGFTAFERVAKPRHGSLYEAAYTAASIKAQIQGLILGRFSEAV